MPGERGRQVELLRQGVIRFPAHLLLDDLTAAPLSPLPRTCPEQLLEFRRGKHDPRPLLAAVDASVRPIIAAMVVRDPLSRPSASECLARMEGSGSIPPAFATVLHPLFAALLPLDTDARLTLVNDDYEGIKGALLLGGAGSGILRGAAAAPLGSGVGGSEVVEAAHMWEWHGSGGTDVDEGPAAIDQAASPGRRTTCEAAAAEPPLHAKVSSLLSHSQALLQELKEGGSSNANHTSAAAAGIGTARTAESASSHPGSQQESTMAAATSQASQDTPEAADTTASARDSGDDGSCMVLLAVLLCTLLRGSRLQELKSRAVIMLCDCAAYCGGSPALGAIVGPKRHPYVRGRRCMAGTVFMPMCTAWNVLLGKHADWTAWICNRGGMPGPCRRPHSPAAHRPLPHCRLR